MSLDKEDRTHQELLALQEVACADIAFFKNQQWQAAYYGSLLYAAAVFVPQAVGEHFPAYGFFVLGTACFLILGGGIYVLSELEAALMHRRELLPKLRKHFTDEALMAYGVGDPNRALLAAGEKTSLRWIFVALHTRLRSSCLDPGPEMVRACLTTRSSRRLGAARQGPLARYARSARLNAGVMWQGKRPVRYFFLVGVALFAACTPAPSGPEAIATFQALCPGVTAKDVARYDEGSYAQYKISYQVQDQHGELWLLYFRSDRKWVLSDPAIEAMSKIPNVHCTKERPAT